MRVKIQSRTGNALLGVLGVLYLFAALALLVYDLVYTWGAASLIERAVQVALVGCALMGSYFAVSAARNLALRLPRHEAPPHREGVVAGR